MSSLIQIDPDSIPTGYRNGFEAYKLYVAVSSHITQAKYDASKYRWKRKINAAHSPDAFPDKYTFDKIAKRYPREDWSLLFARVCINSGWVRDILSDDAEQRYLESRGFLENAENKFVNLFRSYLLSLHNKGMKFTDSLTGQTPWVFTQLQQKVYPIEFVVLLDAVSPFLANNNSIVYGGISQKIHKYSKLFCIDKKILSHVVKSACS
jgi:hypothetical protein